MTRRGVDYHSLGFVDDDEVVVFINDVEGNCFRQHFTILHRGKIYGKGIPRLCPHTFRYRHAFFGHCTCFQQLLNGTAGHVQCCGQNNICPLSGVFFQNGNRLLCAVCAHVSSPACLCEGSFCRSAFLRLCSWISARIKYRISSPHPTHTKMSATLKI